MHGIAFCCFQQALGKDLGSAPLAGAALSRYRLPIFELGGWTLDINIPEGKPNFDVLTDYAIFGAVIFETLAVSTIFVFRRRLPVFRALEQR